VVILIFIFLTPKSWFQNGERPAALPHQSPVIRKVLLSPQVVANERDTSNIGQQVKAVTGRNDIKILAVRSVVDAKGKIIGFEVDIE
jgi:hypothetical protein